MPRPRVPRDPTSPTPRVVWLLIAINVAVYLLWHTIGQSDAGLEWMSRHFLVSAESALGLRLWTLLTSGFSHVAPGHLLVNMLALWVFGAEVCRAVGVGRFLHLYGMGAAIASLAHVAWSLLAADPTPALGASGAVMAIAAVFGALFPRRILLVNFFIPVPAALAVAIYILGDAVGLFGGGGGVAHAAHLGGAFYGLVWWFLTLRQRRRKRR